ncbi:MAG: hypothetical protein Q9188_001278 [Gyalolechia gomerana]
MSLDDHTEMPEVFRWALDVQPEWPCPDAIKSGRDAAPRWAIEHEANHALGLLLPEERGRVLRFYHIRDTKLSLASQLLKHCAVSRTCSVPWRETIIDRDERHKPCYIPKGAADKRIEFNVSHHGTLVVLAGSADSTIQIGVDVVQVDPGKDLPKVRQEGWQSWVSTYEAVFSNKEVQDIVAWEPLESLGEDDMYKAKLRHFYAHWCLKEAYVKMTGEALMAPWLQDMEFRNVQVPRANSETSTAETNNDWGEICSDVEIWRYGKKLTQVKMELQAFRDDYMIGTAISTLGASFLPYKLLDLRRDVFHLCAPEVIEDQKRDKVRAARSLMIREAETVIMGTGASAGQSMPKTRTSKHQSPRRLRSPVPDLVEYICRVRGAKGTISHTPPPQVSADDITAFVEALDDGTPNESLHPSRATTPTEKASLMVRKAELGKHVLCRLIKSFLDRSRRPRDRRWTGSLALELLNDCGRNREILSAPESDALRYELGASVINDNDESLRLIAGTIIREMIENGLSANEFWKPEKYPDPPSIFEAVLENASQWTTDFVAFVDELERQGIVSKQRSSSKFAYAVYFGGNVYNTRAGLSILVTLIDELTIIVPSTLSDTAKYIDIPLEHIGAVHLEQGQPGSQPGQASHSAATVLAIHLRAMTDTAYYVNEVGYQPNQVVLAFDALEDATFIKERIEAMNDRAGRIAGLGTTDFKLENLGQSAEMLTQSACLDISSHPNQKRSVTHQNADVSRSGQVLDQSSHASESTSHLPRLANMEPQHDIRDSQQENNVDHIVDKSASNVLVATEILDVRQEFREDETHDRRRSHQEDNSDTELTSFTAWRDGMQAIENAKELESNGPDHWPKISANVSTVDESHRVQENDDDLYSASPPRQNPSVRATIDKSDAMAEKRQPQSVASIESSNTTTRKLSRSMRVGENEKSSEPLPPNTEKGRPSKNGRGGIDKTPASLVKRPGAHKRKSRAVGDTGPSKKRKTNNPISEKSAKGKLVGSSTKKPATSDEYDIPPSPKQVQPKIRKLASNKPRLGEDRAKDQLPAMTSKPVDAGSPSVNGAAETRAPKIGKTATKKLAGTLAETDRDQDLVVDTDNDDASHVDEKDVESNKKRTKKAKLKATSKGQIKDEKQTAKTNTKKAIKVKDGAPNRSPRKPRAAAQKAKKKILAIDNGDSEGEDVSSQQENSNDIGMAADALSERSSSDDGPTSASKAYIARKKQRNPNVRDSIGSKPKPGVDAEQHTASGKLDAHAESPILNAQPAMQHLASHPIGQVQNSEGVSNLSAIVSGDQASAQRIAPAIPNHVLAPQQSLESNGRKSIVFNASAMDTETHKIGSEALSHPIPGYGGQHPETEDTHFHVAMAPLMPDAADLFVDDRHPPVEHDLEINRGPENGTRTTFATRDKAVAGAAPDRNVQPEGSRPPGKALGTQPRDGREEMTSGFRHAPKSALQEEDSKPLDQPTDKTPEQTFAAYLEEHSQGLEGKLCQTQTREPDHGSKISGEGTSQAHVDGNASVVPGTPDTSDMLYLHKDPVDQVLYPTVHQRLYTAEPVGGNGSSNNTHGGMSGTSLRLQQGQGVIEDDGCGTRQSQSIVATEASRSLSRVPPRSKFPLSASLVPEIESDDEKPKTSNHKDDEHLTRDLPDVDVDSAGIPSAFPVNLQPQAPQSVSEPLREESTIKKRPAEAFDQLQRKKRKLLRQVHSSSGLDTPSTERHKDPSRIPQVISFSAKGPRNQGISSPAISLKAQPAAQNQQVKHSTADEIPLHRKDIGAMTIDESDIASPTRPQNRGAERSRMALQDDNADVLNGILASEPALRINPRPRNETRNPLIDHDNLFAADDGPKVSSQSSRVTENGSPMPAQRTLITKLVMKEPAGLHIAPSESNGTGTPFNEGETTFVQQQDDESPELELPRFVAPGDTRKKQVGFIGSSNSKHRPSSPSAPSAMLTEVEAHMAEPSGQFVNMQTDEVLIPSNLQDPFVNKRGQRPTTFMEKLRYVSDVGYQEDHAATHPRATEQHPGRHFAITEEDPDETLVEVPTGQSRRRGQATTMTASTGSTSQSNHQSRTSAGSNASDAIYERWRGALEPHQENMLTVLCEISHNLFGHLINAETAISDVVKDYQHRGERVIKNLADDLERELGQYIETVGVRRRETKKKLESLNSNVTKNLQRKSKAEGLAVQMEERQKMIDEQMKAAFTLCDESMD